jgi:hypothetical protein
MHDASAVERVSFRKRSACRCRLGGLGRWLRCRRLGCGRCGLWRRLRCSRRRCDGLCRLCRRGDRSGGSRLCRWSCRRLCGRHRSSLRDGCGRLGRSLGQRHGVGQCWRVEGRYESSLADCLGGYRRLCECHRFIRTAGAEQKDQKNPEDPETTHSYLLKITSAPISGGLALHRHPPHVSPLERRRRTRWRRRVLRARTLAVSPRNRTFKTRAQLAGIFCSIPRLLRRVAHALAAAVRAEQEEDRRLTAVCLHRENFGSWLLRARLFGSGGR